MFHWGWWGLASSVSSFHVNHHHCGAFFVPIALPLTQQCNRVHAVGLNEPGQIDSSSRQLSFVPLIMRPRYILNISWFQQFELCMCGTLYLVVVRIPLRKCLITILIAVYLSRSQCTRFNPRYKAGKRKRHRESERGLLWSMGMRMGREAISPLGFLLPLLLSPFLPISSYDDLAHSAMWTLRRWLFIFTPCSLFRDDEHWGMKCFSSSPVHA